MASCRACLWGTYCARSCWRPWQTPLYPHNAHRLLRAIAINQTDTQIEYRRCERPREGRGLLRSCPGDRGQESVSEAVYSFAGAAKTKYHRLGVLRSRNQFSHDSGGFKSEVMAPGLRLLLRPLPCLADGRLPPVSHTASPLCVSCPDFLFF